MQAYFPKALALLVRESSVGNSAMKAFGATVGDVLGWDGLEYDPGRVRFLEALVRDRVNGLLEGSGEADPLNVFIKDEPHKEEKTRQGIHRLILAVSLEDAMVDRMLFCDLQTNVVDRHEDLPTKIGWSPLAGGYKRLYRAMTKKEKLALDRSAWDWMVPGYLVDHWEEFLVDMVVDIPKWMETLIRRRMAQLFRPGCKLRFRDGAVFEQDFTGLMKSGCYLTLFLNSLSQVILHRMALFLLGREDDDGFFHAMGDDTIQGVMSWMDDYLAVLRAMGVSIKEPVIKPYAEFCGFAFDDKRCVPVYWKKHLYKVFCDVRPSWDDTVRDYYKLYCYSEAMRGLLKTVLKELLHEPIR